MKRVFNKSRMLSSIYIQKGGDIRSFKCIQKGGDSESFRVIVNLLKNKSEIMYVTIGE